MNAAKTSVRGIFTSGTYNPFKAHHDFTKFNTASSDPRPFKVPPAVATTTPTNNIPKAIRIARNTPSRPTYRKPTALRGPYVAKLCVHNCLPLARTLGFKCFPHDEIRSANDAAKIVESSKSDPQSSIRWQPCVVIWYIQNQRRNP